MNDARPYASLSSGLLARKGTAKPAMRPQGYGNLEDLGWNDMGNTPGEPVAPTPLPEHVPSSIAALTPAPKAITGVHADQQDLEEYGGNAEEYYGEEYEEEEEAVEEDHGPVVNPLVPPAEFAANPAEEPFPSAAPFQAPVEAAHEEHHHEPHQSADPFQAPVEAAHEDHQDEPLENVGPGQPVEPFEAPPPVIAQQRAILERFDGEEPEAAEPPRSERADIVPMPQRQAAAEARKAAFTLRLDSERHLRLRLACAVSGRSAQQIVARALDEALASIPELETLASQLPAKTGRAGNRKA